MRSIIAVVFTLLNLLLLASGSAIRRDVCEQCNPLPGLNRCDITTSCIRTEPTGQYHCACRAGYQADTSDPNVNWRTLFIGQEYRVFVKPGVVCGTLCTDYTEGPNSCKAVTVRPECS